MNLTPIIQKEPTGCGIACAAILSGISYDEAKKTATRLGIHASDENLWSETTHVRRLLTELGIKTSREETDFSDWDALPDLALLAIKYHLEINRPFWHWVVFYRQAGQPVVLDPAAYLEKNERTDFENIQPKWFIEILNR